MDLECLRLIMLYNPPTVINHNGKQIRRRGSSLYYPFWNGYDGLSCRYEKTSPAYVVFIAGKEYKKLGGKDYPKK